MYKLGMRILHLCLLLIICARVACGSEGITDTLTRPNIIIIVADDLGWGDVGYLGSDIKTPNIDFLAKEGVVLDNFYTAPVCSPTRAGLMTGRYPNRFGLRKTVVTPWSKFGVDTGEVFLSTILADAGYAHRAAFGKWHLGHAKRMYLPLQRGFSYFYGHYNGAVDYFTHVREGELDWHRNGETCYDEGYATDLITEEVVLSIRKFANDRSPFFMYVAYNAPHLPLQAKEADLSAYGYDSSKPSFSSNGQKAKGKGNTKRQTHAAMVSAMDYGIGKIISALREADLEEQTLVLFFSDNGAAPNQGGSSGPLRGSKFTEWEGGVRSPAVIRWPQGFAGGRLVTQVTGYIDIVPTIREILGLTAPSTRTLDGVSIWPILSRGKQQEIPRDFYLGYGTLISGHRWKLVKANAGNPAMNEETDLLFDIRNDPFETTDVKAEYPTIYQEMLQRVLQYDAINPGYSVPPYEEGRQGFVAPKEWKVKN